MFLRLIKATLIALVVGFLGLAIWLAHSLNTPGSLPSPSVFFEIKKGAEIRKIARSLEEEGLIKSRIAFLAAYRLFYSPRSIKAGEYVFSSPVRARDILSALVEGRIYLHALTIPEGLTGLEIVALLAPILADGDEGYRSAFQNTALVAAIDPEATNLEGYLYPETYHFARDTPAAQAIRAMVAQFHSVFNEAWRARARMLGMTVRQIVTLASLIEKETAIPAEKPLVSAVFHNRLRRGMKLDCDPTITYAFPRKPDQEGHGS